MTTITLVIAVITIFIACAQAPGTMALNTRAVPLTPAYSRLFRSTLKSSNNAVWLSFPAIMYTAFIMLGTTTRRLHSLCSSGLLPHITLLLTHGQRFVFQLPQQFCFSISNQDFFVANDNNLVEGISSTGVRSGHGKFHKGLQSATSPQSDKASPPSLFIPIKTLHQPHQYSMDHSDHIDHNNADSSISPVVTTPASASLLLINIFVGIASFLLCMLMRYQGSYSQNSFLMMIVYSTLVVGIIIMLAYVKFQEKFACLETTFHSPLKTFGAIYGAGVFFLAIVFTIVKQSHNLRPVISIIVYLVAASVYYFYAARRSQCFSEEEQKVMFVVYVINANIKSQLRRQSLMTLKRDNLVRSMMQRTSYLFGQVYYSSSKSTENSSSSFRSMMRGRNDISVSPSSRSSSFKAGSPTIPQRLVKHYYPQPSSLRTVDSGDCSTKPQASQSTVTGLSVNSDRSSSFDDTHVSLSITEAQDDVFMDVADYFTSCAASKGEGTVIIHIDGCASGKLSSVPIINTSSVSQSNISTAPNSSKKSVGSNQTDNLYSQHKINTPSFQPSLKMKVPGLALLIDVEEEGAQCSPDISPRQQPIDDSTTVFPTTVITPMVKDIQQSTEGTKLTVAEQLQSLPYKKNFTIHPAIKSMFLSPSSSFSWKNTKSSGRASLFGWMFSSISKPRIHTIPDEDEETGAAHNETGNQNEMRSEGNHQDTNQYVLKPQLSRFAGQHDQKPDKYLPSTVSTTSSTLEHTSMNDLEEGNLSVSRKKRRRESFAVPVPRKVYRHSLGEVMIMKNSNLQELFLDSKLGNNAPSSCKSSFDATLSDKNGSHNSIDDGSSGSGKNMAVLPFCTVPSRQQDYLQSFIAMNYMEQDHHEGSSKKNAGEGDSVFQVMNPNNSSQQQLPVKRNRPVRGLLRRSIHQFSTIASQVFPVADDQMEFQEYTKIFVQTMMQDMEQFNADELQTGNQLLNNEILQALPEH